MLKCPIALLFGHLPKKGGVLSERITNKASSLFPIPQSSLSNTKSSAQRAKITEFKDTPKVLETLQNNL